MLFYWKETYIFARKKISRKDLHHFEKVYPEGYFVCRLIKC